MRRTGPGHGLGRTHPPAGPARREGFDHHHEGRVRGSEPGPETAHPDRRDVRRRRQHRRYRPAALGRHEASVRQRLRALDRGNAAARVQLRPCPPARIRAPRTPDRTHRPGRDPARPGRAGVHRHRLATAPGLRTRQTRRELRTHENRRQTDPAQRPVPAGDDAQHGGLHADHHRDATARRESRIR